MMASERLSATHSEPARLDQLTKTPYIQVLTYPRISLAAARSRIRQLERLGVEELIFEGRAKVGRLGILGLGTVGIVVRARAGEHVMALKIRRTDANRPDMEQEARITSMVNRLGIGPTVYGHTKDLMLMKLLNSVELEEWLRGLRGQGTRENAKTMVHSILNQCRKLDIMGIDHGQLSNLRKHAVVANGVPWIIDFESAGTVRKPKNVTTAAQYLFIGGRLSPRLRRIIGVRDTRPLLMLLSEYKKDTSDYTYSKIIEALKLAQD
jgi:putative serine/threonine protein kinase